MITKGDGMWLDSGTTPEPHPRVHHGLSVLVTGGAGYVGSNTALALLEQGHRVIILDDLSTSDGTLIPPDAIFIRGDVADSRLLQTIVGDIGCDAVMHFAASISVAESETDPAKYYRNNLAKTIELASVMANAGVGAFIFSSTAAVYGEGDGIPLAEDHPLAPINVYGRSKAMAETALADIARASGMGLGILRYFNAAGADPSMRSGQATPHPHHLIEIASHVATGQRPSLAIFGTDYPTADGTAVRDYVHVRDIADAHLLVMDHCRRFRGISCYNVGTGQGASVRMVIDALAQCTNEPITEQEAPRRIGDPAVLVADSTRLRTELGWSPRYHLNDIVRHALLWETIRRKTSPQAPVRRRTPRLADL